MKKKASRGSGDMKKSAMRLVDSVQEVVMEGARRATGFKSAKAFKRSLMKNLDSFRPFHKAVEAYHGMAKDREEEGEARAERRPKRMAKKAVKKKK